MLICMRGRGLCVEVWRERTWRVSVGLILGGPGARRCIVLCGSVFYFEFFFAVLSVVALQKWR